MNYCFIDVQVLTIMYHVNALFFPLIVVPGLATAPTATEAAAAPLTTPVQRGRTTARWSTTTEPWPTPTATKPIIFPAIFPSEKIYRESAEDEVFRTYSTNTHY